MWAFLELGQVVERITEERAPAALASLSYRAKRSGSPPRPRRCWQHGAKPRARVAARIRAQLADSRR